MHRRALTACFLVACLVAGPSFGADLPKGPPVPHHTRGGPSRTVVLAPAVAAPPVAVVAAPPVAVVVGPELGAGRPPAASPTAIVLPGAAGLPASIDLSPVFLPQRACAPGFSPDALQSCRRHGELRVACDPSALDCVPLPPDPMPYGPGAAARLAY